MNNRRHFFRQLSSGLVVAAAPQVFMPKLTKPTWPKLKSFEYRAELLVAPRFLYFRDADTGLIMRMTVLTTEPQVELVMAYSVDMGQEVPTLKLEDVA